MDSCAAGIVADQLPSAAGVTDTGAVEWELSLADTATAVASGCATPETVIDPSVTELGALVIAFLAQGAIESQPACGPAELLLESFPPTTALVVVEGLPKKPAWVSVTVSPGCRSGVSASESAPFCQQSPAGFSGVGVVVLTENGVNGLALAEYCPITTGLPVTVSGRVAWTVAWPKDERLLATTESPLTTIVGELPAACAGELTAAAVMMAPAAGAIRLQIIRRRGVRAD